MSDGDGRGGDGRGGNELRRPRRLRAGDRLAALTLSWGGPGALPHRYEAGKRQLEAAFGVELVELPGTCRSPDEVAADPAGRAADLHAALADPTIAGVVSTIGGDDSIRLLPHLDLDLLAANPKVVLGYSDTTISHLALRRAGIVSFYGPAVMAGFAEKGGLEVLDWTRGTEWWPDLSGAVLVLETSEEAPPPALVTRFLRTLAVTGELSQLAGLVFGRPGGSDLPVERHTAYDDAVVQVVRCEQQLAHLPVVTGVDLGHTDPIWTVPFGVDLRVDPEEERLTFLEAGVR